jgi:hypothetical protein
MAVNIKYLEEKALKLLEKNRDIYFFTDLAMELGYNRQYLYEVGFSPDKNDTLKEALDNNKKYIKRGLRNKWYKNDNATTQVALYKLLADDDELARLNNNIDLSLNGHNFNIVVADKHTQEELEEV